MSRRSHAVSELQLALFGEPARAPAPVKKAARPTPPALEPANAPPADLPVPAQVVTAEPARLSSVPAALPVPPAPVDEPRALPELPGVDEETRQAARELAVDLVLRAGAGTGKTHTLVQVVVHLAAGVIARVGRRVPLARVLMMTFSEKAAAELRERVRERFLALAEAPRADGGLEAAYARAGVPPLSAEDWRVAAMSLGAAPITTFHGFAAGVLRRHAGAAGLDPAFELLDEDEASSLLRGRTEEIVLAALDTEDATVQALVRELEYSRGLDGFARGLVEHIVEVVNRLREEGRAPADLAGELDDDRAATRLFAQARDQYAAALNAMHAALAGKASAGVVARHTQLTDARAELAATLERLHPSRDPAEEPAIAFVAQLTKGGLGSDTRRAAQLALRAALDTMREAHVAHRAGPLARAFLTLATRALDAYDDAKRALAVLDFTDLIRRSRDLILADGAVRAEERARFDAVLVDEFQDTNELQDALVAGVRAPETPLLVVGDPKQSIYEFRGADVAVFERVAERVAGSGGAALALTESRRGRAPLAAFVNRLFAHAMPRPGAGAHPFDVAFDPARDALHAHRGGTGVCVDLLGEDVTEGAERVLSEGALVAKHLRALVDSKSHVVWEKRPDGTEAPRPIRFGDVAILLRRFSHLDAFLQELRRAAIPHYVVNGRGFFEAQEIRDLVHALALLDDPADSIALVGVLRSPLVALSDRSLLELAEAAPRRKNGGPGALALAPLLADDFTGDATLPDGERARLHTFLALYRRLRSHADRLGTAGVLRTLVDETDLAAVLATTFYGEQKVANLERLLTLAAEHDEDGHGDRRAFVRRLRAQAARERSLAPPAQILGEKEDVVRVMTIHQSKGLEFPVVFVPECAATEQHGHGAVVYDRTAGLGLKLRLADGERIASPRARAADELRQARARAESVRLFYVAVTRARDLLVLSGERGASKKGDGAKKSAGPQTWRRFVDELLEHDPEARALVRTVEVSAELDDPVAPAPPSIDPKRLPALAADPRILRALAPPATAARLIVASVTDAGWGSPPAGPPTLGERSGREERVCSGGVNPPAHGAVDCRPESDELAANERGTLAHRVLEQVDLTLTRGERARQVDELIEAEGFAAGDLAVAEVRRQVIAFLEGPCGKSLAARPSSMVLREVPFAFLVGSEDGTRLLLKGQMDLVVLEADDRVTVLDYKFMQDARDEDHRFQLLTYAAAARALFGRQPSVGLVLLRAASPEPRMLSVTDDDLDAHMRHLADIATRMAQARQHGSPR